MPYSKVGEFDQAESIRIVDGREKKKRMRDVMWNTLTKGQSKFFFWIFGTER